MRRASASLAWLCMLVTLLPWHAAAPALAQQTTGTIAGASCATGRARRSLE